MADDKITSWGITEQPILAEDLIPAEEGGQILPTQIASGNLTSPISSFNNVNLGQTGKIYGGATGYNAGTGLWFGKDSDGVWKVFFGNSSGNKLTWSGTALSITGSITATSGTIGGWTIGATSLTAGSGATTTGLDSGGTNPAFYAGSATPGSAPFRVTQAGALVATSATITGAITATSGSFSGALTLGNGSTVSGTLTMSIADGQGDCYIAGGTFTASTWTATNGFILGLDDSDSNKEKFFIGSSSSSLDWNVTAGDTLTVKGTINATGGYIGASTAAIVESTGLNLGTTGHVRGGQTGYNTGSGFFLGYDTSAYKLSIGNSSDTSNLLTWDGSNLTVNGTTLLFQDVFGDGSDGDVTITADTTLTKDMFYDDLTIISGKDFLGVSNQCGWAGKSAAFVGDTFANMRAAAGTNAAHTEITAEINCFTTSGNYDYIKRGILQFDTSTLSAGATISSATLLVYVSSITDQLNQSLSLVKGYAAGEIAAADYNIANWDMTKCASDIDITTISSGAYLTITLNATGLAHIQKAGTSYFGLVISGDADNSAPTWVSGEVASITFQEEAGANPPKLRIINDTTKAMLTTGGYRVFVKGTLTNDGVIGRTGGAGGNGTNASGATKGTAGAAGGSLAAGSIVGAISGVTGGDGGNGGTSVGPAGGGAGSSGTAGNAAAKSVGSAGVAGVTGGAGGAGGAGAGGGAGGAGAAGAQTGTVYNTMKSLASTYYMSDTQSSTLTNFTGSAGTGGSGGGGGGTSQGLGSGFNGGGGGGGGGSGGCGGVVWLAARSIVNSGAITATGGAGGNGGNGANASGGNSGGGGGGGAGCGGTGGVVVVLYNSKSGAGTITAGGGAAGTKGNKGLKSGTGSDGTDGTAGTAGADGVVLTLQI